MKKRLIVIVLALVMLVSMTTPAMAHTVDEIIEELNALARERRAAAGVIGAAITRLEADPSLVEGEEEDVLAAIRGARGVGTNPFVEQTNLTPAHINEILGFIDPVLDALGLTRTTGVNIIQGFSPGAVIANTRVVDAATGEVLWPIPGAPARAAAGGGAAARAAPDDVIRQTGFSADYSVLLLVAATLFVMLISAIVFTLRLRLRSGGAK